MTQTAHSDEGRIAARVIHLSDFSNGSASASNDIERNGYYKFTPLVFGESPVHPVMVVARERSGDHGKSSVIERINDPNNELRSSCRWSENWIVRLRKLKNECYRNLPHRVAKRVRIRNGSRKGS